MTSPGIFTLRTYAIYGRSRTVFFLLAVPALAALSSAIILVTQTAAALPRELQFGALTCGFYLAPSASVGSAVLVNFTSEAVFDVLVVILTESHTGRLALQSRKTNISGSLSFILARDGVLYYSAIFVPQIVLIVLNAIVLKTQNANLGDVLDALSKINDVLQIVLVNRLILNLCHAANPSEDSEYRTRTGLKPPTFAASSVLGNIGGSLRTLPDDFDDEIIGGEERAEMDEVLRKTTEPLNSNGAGNLNGFIELHHDDLVEDV